MKPEYHEGKEAQASFEKTTAALFKVKNSELEEKPERKDDTASKD